MRGCGRQRPLEIFDGSLNLSDTRLVYIDIVWYNGNTIIAVYSSCAYVLINLAACHGEYRKIQIN
jgi:hypothetical protein